MIAPRAIDIGHRRGDAAERTLTLAAAAALAGLAGDGGLVAAAEPPSISMIAGLARMRRDTACKSLLELAAAGELRLDRRGSGRAAQVVVEPAALVDRWAAARQRCRLTTELLQLGLRPRVAIVAGLVLGQHGTDDAVSTVPEAKERLDWPLRSVERALGDAVHAGVLERVGARGGWRAGPALTPAAARTQPLAAIRASSPIVSASTPSSTCPDSAVNACNLSEPGGVNPSSPIELAATCPDSAGSPAPSSEALRIAVVRVIGDRQLPDVVAAGLGLQVHVVVAAVAAERARRESDRPAAARRAAPLRLGASRQGVA